MQTPEETSLLSRELISFSDAARLLPGKPHPSTIWRWCLRGVRGIRLKSWLVGGRRYTDSRSIFEFIEATTAATAGPTAPAHTPTQRATDNERAKEELMEGGFYRKNIGPQNTDTRG